MRQAALTERQEKFMKHLTKFLKENPEAAIEVNQMEYAQKEKEYILLYEARKKYFLMSRNIKTNSFTKQDSLAVIKMPVKDSAFIRFINKHISLTEVFTLQEKCARFAGGNIV